MLITRIRKNMIDLIGLPKYPDSSEQKDGGKLKTTTEYVDKRVNLFEEAEWGESNAPSPFYFFETKCSTSSSSSNSTFQNISYHLSYHHLS